MISFAAGLLLPLAAVAVEKASRDLLRSRPYRVRTPNQRSVFALNQSIHPSLSPTVTFCTNEDGERGTRIAACGSRPLRILVAGGSAAECYYLSDGETWPGRLQQLLNESHALRNETDDKVYVGNVGRSGVDALATAFVLEKTLPQYAVMPRIVLTMIGAGDVAGWLRAGGTKAAPAAVSSGEYFDEHPDAAFGLRLKDWAFTEVCRRLRRRYGRRGRGEVGAWVHDARVKRMNATVVLDDVPDASSGLERFSASLQRVVRVIRHHGSTPIVVGQPWFRAERYTDEERRHFWSGAIRGSDGRPSGAYYSERVLGELLLQVYETGRAVAASLRVPFVDLQERLPSDLDHYYDFFHFTPRGAEMVAKALVDEVGTRLFNCV